MPKLLNYKKPLLFILIIITFGSCGISRSVSEKELNDHWYFKKSLDTLWKNATVPGTVHTDLLALQEIEEPYYWLK